MLCEQHRPGAVDGGGGAGRHRQHDRLPEALSGAARTELESQLQRAVKVSAKGKHVKCKMDLERCLFWDPAGNRVPRPAEFARRRGRALVEARHVWLMARQWGVLFEVRHLWRRRAARSRPPPAARSSWPVRRPRTGGAA